MSHDSTVTVELTPDAADAIVYATAMALSIEAETLHNMPMSTPGDLQRLGDSSKRIGRLADVNEQLEWRKHWRGIDARPEPLTVSFVVLSDILGELAARSQEQRNYGDDEVEGAFAYDEAARQLALALASGTRCGMTAEPEGATA